MSKRRTFIDLCCKGEAMLGDIDDFVDAWHDGDSKESLAEYLGMTGSEYELWVESPQVLAAIIAARKSGRALKRSATGSISTKAP